MLGEAETSVQNWLKTPGPMPAFCLGFGGLITYFVWLVERACSCGSSRVPQFDSGVPTA